MGACRQTRMDAEVRARGDYYQRARVRRSHRFKDPGRYGDPRETCYYCGMTKQEAAAQERLDRQAAKEAERMRGVPHDFKLPDRGPDDPPTWNVCTTCRGQSEEPQHSGTVYSCAGCKLPADRAWHDACFRAEQERVRLLQRGR